MKSMVEKILHEPTLSSILMIEKAIIDADTYYTRTQLWKSLRALNYLEASGKIEFNTTHIIYTGVNNPKLAALLKSSVKI
jgi:hypothetical protein